MGRSLLAPLAALVLTLQGVVAPAAHGAIAVVPNQYPTIQQAADAADTVWIRSGTYAENVYVGLGETGPRVIRRHPDSIERPRVSRLQLSDGHGQWSPVQLVGLEITGSTRFDVYRFGQTFDFDACVLDSSVAVFAYYGPSVSFRMTRSRIIGDIGGFAGPLADPDIFMDADTLIGGGVYGRGAGRATIKNCVFDGPGDLAMNLGDDVLLGAAHDNRIDDYRIGIAAGGDATLELRRNVITNCQYGVRADGGGLLAHENLIGNCGTGIWATDEYSSNAAEVVDNLVLGSTDIGIRLRYDAGRVDVRGNVVGRSGGHGIVVETYSYGPDYPPGTIDHNTSYANQGSGLVLAHRTHDIHQTLPPRLTRNIGYGNGRYGLEWSQVGDYPETPPAVLDYDCNDWYANALGSVNGTPASPGDFELDPVFCDVDADSISLQAGSSLLDAPGCGLIGARGTGCAVTAALVSLFAAERSSLGVRIRWQLAIQARGEVWVERADASGGPWSRIPTERALEGSVTVDTDGGALPERDYWYRLVAGAGGVAEVITPPVEVAAMAAPPFTLEVAWTSGRRARFDFGLAQEGWIDLRVLDIQGRSVASLARGVWPLGRHAIEWSPAANGAGKNNRGPAGIYFARYSFPGGEITRKLILLP